jgi:hypothetical protein
MRITGGMPRQATGEWIMRFLIAALSMAGILLSAEAAFSLLDVSRSHCRQQIGQMQT